MDELNDQTQTYDGLLEKYRAARDRMSLGSETLKEENSFSQLQSRMRHRLRAWGMGYADQESSFDQYEQFALARGDKLHKAIQRGADIGFGGVGIGMTAMEFLGVGSTKISSKLGLGSLATSVAGMGKTGAFLANASTAANPYLMAAQVALTLGQGGFQHSMMDPFTNTRMFESSALGGMRSVLGGTQSNRAFGGMDMSSALGFGKQMQQGVAWGNKQMSGDQINQFVKAATEMPQLQYVQNADQAIQGMSKFVDIMVKMSKQFKGKEQDIIQAFQQFGQMGMSLGQSQQAFMYTTRMGGMLNVAPSAIMGAGANAIQNAMQSGTLGGINQGTMFMTGAQNYVQAERMRQSGALSPTQLQNFGGTQGIANTMTGIQTNFLKSGAGNLFLKSIYDPNSPDKINRQMLDKMVGGNYDLGDARQKAMEVTLNPKANMDFAMQKDFIIGKLGADVNQFTYSAWDKQFANKSPFGKDLTGRAKWLQLYQGMGQQEAFIAAQSWMSNNPQMEQYLKKEQMTQTLLQSDPFYSSQSGLGVAANTIGRDAKRWWQNDVMYTGVGGLFNPGTKPYEQLWNGVGNVMGGMVGWNGIVSGYEKATTTKSLEEFAPFSKVKDGKELGSILTMMRTDKKFGKDAWTAGGNAIKNRGLARMLASDNVPELVTNEQDRKALLNIQSDVEKSMLGANTVTSRDILGTAGKLLTSPVWGVSSLVKDIDNYKTSGDKQQELFDKYKNMSNDDVLKDIDKQSEKYALDKGLGEMKDGKFVGTKMDAQGGMQIDVLDNIKATMMKTVLSEERRSEILKTQLKGAGGDITFNSPYKNENMFFESNKWNTATQLGIGYFTGPIGILGMAGKSIFDTFKRGGKNDYDAIKGFKAKFDTAEVESKGKMLETLQQMSKRDESQWTASEYDVTGLGKNADQTDVKTMLQQFSKKDAYILTGKTEGLDAEDVKKWTDERANVLKMSQGQNVAKGMQGLFSSEGYQSKAKSFGAEGDFFKNLFGQLYGGAGGSTKISAGDFKKMKQQLKNTPGLGELMRDEFMEYDEATGQAKFKDTSSMTEAQKKRFKKAEERFGTNLQGKNELYQLQSADQVWNNRGDSAKTIQDFAVAVAKGMNMWQTGTSDLEGMNWQGDKNKTLDKNQNSK